MSHPTATTKQEILESNDLAYNYRRFYWRTCIHRFVQVDRVCLLQDAASKQPHGHLTATQVSRPADHPFRARHRCRRPRWTNRCSSRLPPNHVRRLTRSVHVQRHLRTDGGLGERSCTTDTPSATKIRLATPKKTGKDTGIRCDGLHKCPKADINDLARVTIPTR